MPVRLAPSICVVCREDLLNPCPELWESVACRLDPGDGFGDSYVPAESRLVDFLDEFGLLILAGICLAVWPFLLEERSTLLVVVRYSLRRVPKRPV